MIQEKEKDNKEFDDVKPDFDTHLQFYGAEKEEWANRNNHKKQISHET